MKRAATILALVLVLVAAATATSGCGSSTKSVTKTGANGLVTTEKVPNVTFAKTRFALHMGIALGAFHRYIYKPFKARAFSRGAKGRITALAKAAAAALFAVHELRQAKQDALSDKRLRPLAQRVDGLAASLGSLGSSLKGGAGVGQISSVAGSAGALSAASSGLGVVVRELAPSL
jgi:hypothetical protein